MGRVLCCDLRSHRPRPCQACVCLHVDVVLPFIDSSFDRLVVLITWVSEWLLGAVFRAVNSAGPNPFRLPALQSLEACVRVTVSVLELAERTRECLVIATLLETDI